MAAAGRRGRSALPAGAAAAGTTAPRCPRNGSAGASRRELGHGLRSPPRAGRPRAAGRPAAHLSRGWEARVGAVRSQVAARRPSAPSASCRKKPRSRSAVRRRSTPTTPGAAADARISAVAAPSAPAAVRHLQAVGERTPAAPSLDAGRQRDAVGQRGGADEVGGQRRRRVVRRERRRRVGPEEVADAEQAGEGPCFALIVATRSKRRSAPLASPAIEDLDRSVHGRGC